MKPLPTGFYPFWFWNDTITDEEIRWQVAQMADQGILGFFIHSRQGLKDPAYLSEAFLDRVVTAVEAARDHGLYVNLYDEYPYPSGVAGGMVVLGDPCNLATELVQRIYDVEGGNTRIALPTGKVLSLLAYPLQAGQVLWEHSVDLQPAVGVVLEEDSYQETGLTRYNQKRYFANRPRPTLQTNLPPGHWRIFASVQRIVENHKYWHNFADMLNRETVNRFIELTHQRYFQRLGAEFGKTIRWIFTDEVVAGWTPKMPEAFQAEYGADLLELLPVLQDPDHPDHIRVSVELHRLKLKLFEDTFEKPISTWCRDHGIAYAAEKPSLRFSQLSYQDIPGCEPGHVKAGGILDLLQPSLRGNAKATASAAYFYGKDGALDECYHSLGWSATLEDIRWMADAQLLLGIRYLVPHGFFYTTHNLRKHDAPPSLFFQEPFWPLFKLLSDRVERIGQTFDQTYINAQLAVVDPTAGLPTPGDRTAYERLMHTLMGAHLDFHIVDTDLLTSGRLAPGKVQIKDVTFRTILVPPMQFIEPPLAAWLENFIQNGGQVVHCPANFQKADLLAELGQNIHPSLRLRSAGVENTALWSVQRCQGDRTVWMVLNISSSVQTVELDAGLPLVEIPLDRNAGLRLEWKNGRFSRTFAPFEACLLETAPAVNQDQNLPLLILSIPEELEVYARSANLARLYDWQLSLLDDTGAVLQSSGVQAVPLANQLEQGGFRFTPRVSRVFGTPPLLSWPELHLSYETSFDLDFSGPVELVMEPGSIGGDWSLTINHSQPLGENDFQPTQAHVRGSLGLALNRWLQPGKNILTVNVKTNQPDGGLLNPLYLAGDFGVSLRPLRITARPTVGKFEEYAENRLPFYAGVLEYKVPLELTTLPEDPRLRVVFDFPATFHDACEVIFNHGEAHAIPWGPYEVVIERSELNPGRNVLILHVFTTLIRSFEGQEFDPLQHKYVPILGI